MLIAGVYTYTRILYNNFISYSLLFLGVLLEYQVKYLHCVKYITVKNGTILKVNLTKKNLIVSYFN